DPLPGRRGLARDEPVELARAAALPRPADRLPAGTRSPGARAPARRRPARTRRVARTLAPAHVARALGVAHARGARAAARAFPRGSLPRLARFPRANRSEHARVSAQRLDRAPRGAGAIGAPRQGATRRRGCRKSP